MMDMTQRAHALVFTSTNNMDHYPTIGDKVKYIRGFDGSPSETEWTLKRFEMYGMALLENEELGECRVSVDSIVFANTLKYTIHHCPECICSRCKDVNATEESDRYDQSNCHQQ